MHSLAIIMSLTLIMPMSMVLVSIMAVFDNTSGHLLLEEQRTIDKEFGCVHVMPVLT